jgi:hypothetical protein
MESRTRKETTVKTCSEEKKMINPISDVKNTRTTYNRFRGENITEVEVQFKEEDPTWIPIDTLLSIMEWELEVNNG